MKRYVLTPSAKRDVNDIWDYIANDSIEAADRVLDALAFTFGGVHLRPRLRAVRRMDSSRLQVLSERPSFTRLRRIPSVSRS